MNEFLSRTDPEAFAAIAAETRRQNDNLELIALVLRSPSDAQVLERVRREVLELTGRFPLYPERLAAIAP